MLSKNIFKKALRPVQKYNQCCGLCLFF